MSVNHKTVIAKAGIDRKRVRHVAASAAIETVTPCNKNTLHVFAELVPRLH